MDGRRARLRNDRTRPAARRESRYIHVRHERVGGPQPDRRRGPRVKGETNRKGTHAAHPMRRGAPLLSDPARTHRSAGPAGAVWRAIYLKSKKPLREVEVKQRPDQKEVN